MGRDIHTCVLRSEMGCRIRDTHVHTRSDCVHTREDTVRLDYASRFVRVICSSHVVSIKLYRDTLRRCVVDWQHTNDKTVQIEWCFPHSSTCCFLAVLPALVQTLPSARPQEVLPTCLLALQLRCLPSSLKHCCPLPRESRSGGATRTRLAVPLPRATLLPCSSGRALCTCPDDASHVSNVASLASVSLQFWHCSSQVP